MQQHHFQSYRPGPPPVFQSDRILGILGIVLFSCCSVLGVLGAVGRIASGGAQSDLPISPEGWMIAVSLVLHPGMLIGSIGLAQGRKWGMQMLVVMGSIGVLFTIFNFFRFLQLEDVLRTYYEESGLSPDSAVAGAKAGALTGVIPMLLFTVYPALRLTGRVGPEPL